MDGPWYLITERFDPGCGERWMRYLSWAKLPQLTEAVSLDESLCPRPKDGIRAEDWPHIVDEDFMLDYFTDLEYLLRRRGGAAGRNLLCLFRNPKEHPTPPSGPYGFRFEGYELEDVQGGISALTNCGGFPLAFAAEELNSHGLLPTLERAREVRKALRRHYPQEPHADCHVWALFRALPS